MGVVSRLKSTTSSSLSSSSSSSSYLFHGYQKGTSPLNWLYHETEKQQKSSLQTRCSCISATDKRTCLNETEIRRLRRLEVVQCQNDLLGFLRTSLATTTTSCRRAAATICTRPGLQRKREPGPISQYAPSSRPAAHAARRPDVHDRRQTDRQTSDSIIA